jgi:predicted phosphodiesterase
MDFLNDDYVYHPPEEHMKLVEEYRQKKKEEKTKDLVKILQINDVHIPYHDKKTLKAVFEFTEYYKPDKLVIAGDFLDFYELSKFDKNPSRKSNLQDEITEAIEILGEFKKLIPEIHFIKGNHEDRLRSYLWKSPELSSLDALDLGSLLSLNRMNIDYHEHSYHFNKFIFTHGSKISQQSSYSARRELETHGTSGSSGHTHRLGASYKTDYRGTIGWFENGCLCNLNPEYIQGKPNWQQAISVFNFIDDRFFCQQIPIIDNEFIFDGRRFS